MYCYGLCENLDEKKHVCNLTGEKFSYMRRGGRQYGFTVHEHNGICEQDTKTDEERKNEQHLS